MPYHQIYLMGWIYTMKTDKHNYDYERRIQLMLRRLELTEL